MRSIAELIEAVTPSALSAATGVSVQGVSNMKQRGAIPPRHWPAVLRLVQRLPEQSDFAFEDLEKLHGGSGHGGQSDRGAGARHADQRGRNPRARAGAA